MSFCMRTKNTHQCESDSSSIEVSKINLTPMTDVKIILLALPVDTNNALTNKKGQSVP